MIISMKIEFPSFSSSEKELDVTYLYRAELFAMHVKKSPAGFVVSEFLDDVPWAGIYNTISCAAMHHFKEGRWMKDPSPLEDYAAFWCNEGDARLYSFPIADSVLALEKVSGKREIAHALYPHFCRIHDEWDDHKNADGTYSQSCGRDGMEYSISGNGVRPTINSYMYAEKMALSALAERLGKNGEAQAYRAEADALRDKINELLWNETIGMYGVISDGGETQNVKEQIGYVPWIYGIPGEGKGDCFRYLLDPACFLSPHGLRTADATHPAYQKPFRHECLWNGPIWPFATAQTLSAMIRYLHTEPSPSVTAEDFTKLLLTYALSHRDADGNPWLDENMDPDTGRWLARDILYAWGREDKDRGRHYNHSTFIDLVITGLCGICPAEGNLLTVKPLGTSLDHFSLMGVSYHGHELSLSWHKNDGLRLTVDGKKNYFAPVGDTVSLEIEL